jgi:hypothetical protein
MIIEFQSVATKNEAIPAEALGSPPPGHIQVEWLAGSSGASVSRDAIMPIEAVAGTIRDWGSGVSAVRSMIRHFSRPSLASRVRRLFISSGARQGSFPIESTGGFSVSKDSMLPVEGLLSHSAHQRIAAEWLAVARYDSSVPTENSSLANSVIKDATLQIDALSSQRGDPAAEIEHAATLLVDPDTPTEVLASTARDGGDPIEWLTSGTRTTGIAMLPLEWVGAPPAVLVSLEFGTERSRLLATRGRVRLLRRS